MSRTRATHAVDKFNFHYLLRTTLHKLNNIKEKVKVFIRPPSYQLTNILVYNSHSSRGVALPKCNFTRAPPRTLKCTRVMLTRCWGAARRGCSLHLVDPVTDWAWVSRRISSLNIEDAEKKRRTNAASVDHGRSSTQFINESTRRNLRLLLTLGCRNLC